MSLHTRDDETKGDRNDEDVQQQQQRIIDSKTNNHGNGIHELLKVKDRSVRSDSFVEFEDRGEPSSSDEEESSSSSEEEEEEELTTTTETTETTTAIPTTTIITSSEYDIPSAISDTIYLPSQISDLPITNNRYKNDDDDTVSITSATSPVRAYRKSVVLFKSSNKNRIVSTTTNNTSANLANRYSELSHSDPTMSCDISESEEEEMEEDVSGISHDRINEDEDIVNLTDSESSAHYDIPSSSTPVNNRRQNGKSSSRGSGKSSSGSKSNSGKKKKAPSTPKTPNRIAFVESTSPSLIKLPQYREGLKNENLEFIHFRRQLQEEYDTKLYRSDNAGYLVDVRDLSNELKELKEQYSMLKLRSPSRCCSPDPMHSTSSRPPIQENSFSSPSPSKKNGTDSLSERKRRYDEFVRMRNEEIFKKSMERRQKILEQKEEEKKALDDMESMEREEERIEKEKRRQELLRKLREGPTLSTIELERREEKLARIQHQQAQIKKIHYPKVKVKKNPVDPQEEEFTKKKKYREEYEKKRQLAPDAPKYIPPPVLFLNSNTLPTTPSPQSSSPQRGKAKLTP